MNIDTSTNQTQKSHNNSVPWGHSLEQKKQNTIWLFLQNTGGTDCNPQGLFKLAALWDFMEEMDVDVAAMWHGIKSSQIYGHQNKTKYWWENTHWSLTHNQRDLHAAPYQPGGTRIVIFNQLSYRAQCPSDDISGLGRWYLAWSRGKHNQFLRIVSLYWLCLLSGPLSMYQQQIRFWASKKIDCCLHQKLLEDLRWEITKWQDYGDFIVILVNTNEDVISKDLNQFFKGLQLVKLIPSLWSLMPMHQRGSKAIDGIYISWALLKDAKGGILPSGLVIGSNHWSVWLDLRVEPSTRPSCKVTMLLLEKSGSMDHP